MYLILAVSENLAVELNSLSRQDLDRTDHAQQRGYSSSPVNHAIPLGRRLRIGAVRCRGSILSRRSTRCRVMQCDRRYQEFLLHLRYAQHDSRVSRRPFLLCDCGGLRPRQVVPSENSPLIVQPAIPRFPALAVRSFGAPRHVSPKNRLMKAGGLEHRPRIEIMRSSALCRLCGVPDNAEHIHRDVPADLLSGVFLAMDLPVCSALSGVSSQRDLRNRNSSSSGWKRKLPPDGGWSVSSAFSFSSKLVVT